MESRQTRTGRRMWDACVTCHAEKVRYDLKFTPRCRSCAATRRYQAERIKMIRRAIHDVRGVLTTLERVCVVSGPVGSCQRAVEKLTERTARLAEDAMVILWPEDHAAA